MRRLHTLFNGNIFWWVALYGMLLTLLLVCAPGTAYAIASIKDMIELAEPNSTVVVPSGVYNEYNIIINKPLVIIARGVVIVDAQNKGTDVIVVMHDSVKIVGFTVKNVAMSYVNDNAGIKVKNSNYCLIEGCTIENGFFGIYLANSNFCSVRKNKCNAVYVGESQSGNGIHLWTCTHAFIDSNIVFGHRDGIYFEFVKNSLITNNNSFKNFRYGLHFMFSDSCQYLHNVFTTNGAGVAVMYTKHVVMKYNVFEYNWGPTAYGILLKDISDSYMSHCTFYKNTTAIYSEGSSRITIEECDIKNNGWAVKIMANSIDDFFTRNNFIGNTFDVATNSSVAHSSFKGNYWSEYSGYDLDHDSIGDVPYAPVRLSSLIVEKNPPTLMLLHSLFIGILDVAERILPSLTPDALIDTKPEIRVVKHDSI